MKISVLALFLIIAGLEPNIHGQNHVPLRLVRTLTMPKVQGRIDHMALDAERGRLFVAALGNGTLEVLNLRTGTVAQSVAGMKDPQGVVYISETGRFFVTTGGDGKCHVFSGDPLRPVAAIHIGEDADNIRYDASAKRLYVGYGNGALAVIDSSTLKRLGDIKLSGHPESFQLERGGPKIYVNVPDAGHVAVLDRLKLSVLSTWPLKDLHANFPMALIEGDRRIVIAARRPAKLVVIDAGSGNASRNWIAPEMPTTCFTIPRRSSCMFLAARGSSTCLRNGIPTVIRKPLAFQQLPGRAPASGPRICSSCSSPSRPEEDNRQAYASTSPTEGQVRRMKRAQL